MNSENKKNLLLIGATGGIGSAILDRCANEWNVIATGTDELSLNKLKERFKISSLVFDHTSGKEQEFIKSVCEICEKIDAVVIASGITSDALAIRLSDELWEKTIQINLTSIFKILKHVFRCLNKNSSIVLISSVIAKMGNIGQVAYAASKGGLEAMTRTLAKEFSTKATVNAIAPGFIKTKMTENLQNLEAIIPHIPLGRIGEASEVADGVNFLIGSGARYITGHVLAINGGLRMD